MSKSDTTMSTSENEKSARRLVNDGAGQDLTGKLQEPPAGLPDPEVLARLANEFFTALPAAHTVVPGTPYSTEAARGPQASSVGTDLVEYSASPTDSIPSEAQLRALPSTLSAADSYAQVLAGPNAMPSGLCDSDQNSERVRASRSGEWFFLDSSARGARVHD